MAKKRSTTKTAKRKPRGLSIEKGKIARLIALKTKRRKLEREAETLNREERLLRKEVLEFMQTRSPDTEQTVHGQAFQIIERRSVVWKNEFIKVTSAERAAQLAEEVEPTYVLKF